MLSRFRRRRPSLENLERRHLLTSIAPDVLYWPVGEQFTVRRDEAQPVELRVFFDFEYGAFIDQRGADSVPIDAVDSENGSVEIAADGNSIYYQPDPGFVGIDIVTISYATPTTTGGAAFGEGNAAAGNDAGKQIAVNVIEPLVAVDDWFQVNVNAESSTLDVLANDIRNGRYIGEEPTLTVQSSRTDSGGLISVDDDHLRYQPAENFSGIETIIYTAVDQDGYTVEGTAQVRVDDLQDDSLWPEQLEQQLVEAAVQHNQYSFGAPVYQSPGGWYYFGLDGDVAFSDAVPGDTRGPDASGTNNQIAEVDESDRVKTDGEFLYVLSSPDQDRWSGWDIFPWIGLPRGFAPVPEPAGKNLLTIIDVREPESPIIVSRQLFEDRVLSLDLQGDRLTVLSQRDRQTVVTSLDISDPQSIQTVWTTVVDGQFKQARRVGETLYVFTDEYGIHFPPLESVCDEEQTFCFYDTAAQYLQRVRDALTESVFPSQQVFDGADQPVTDVPSVLVDPLDVGVPDYRGRLNIISFDTASDVGGAIDWDISDAAEHVLVTPDSIYTTRTNYNSTHRFTDELPILLDIPEQPTISTAIQRFALLSDGTVDPAAAGAVPGILNNSFSIDEHDGLLRIATENSWWSVSAEDDGTNIYVLQQSAAAFDLIGGVTGLAPGEQIYAVRFAADRGYVVTFRRVDPLFVVDLSEPTAPQVLGELKTPGYSQYLQIIDHNHLIGIGRDADQETGLYKGLIVSLFNVSDPASPVVQDRYEFEGGRTTFSPFAEDDPWDLRDHHAISYFAESGILALPIYSQHNPWNEQQDQPIFDSPDQSAVRTLQIDTLAGIEPLDSIPFDSRADRTVRIGQHLYSLSNDELKVTHLLQPDGVVAALQFERKGGDDFVDSQVGDTVTIKVTENDGVSEDVEILDAALVDGEGEVLIEGKQIRFIPSSRSLAKQRIRYTARDAAGTLIDAVATVDPDIRWQNEQRKLDVNNDGKRSARDALNVINWIDRYGAVDSEEIERQIGDADSTKLYYFDTTGDGQLSARDALLVINDLVHDVVVLINPPGVPDDSGDPEIESPSLNDPGIQAEAEHVASFDTPEAATPEAIDIVLTARASGDDETIDELSPGQ